MVKPVTDSPGTPMQGLVAAAPLQTKDAAPEPTWMRTPPALQLAPRASGVTVALCPSAPLHA